MTYLVTGAAGFIGSKVCEQLLQAGHQVVGIDNLNDYYDVRIKDWRLNNLLGRETADLSRKSPSVSSYLNGSESQGKFSFYPVDIENLEALDSLFDTYKFDAVINLAARAGVRYSMDNPHVYMTTNAVGTLNLLECQKKHGVKKHVLASTSSLYAGCEMPFMEEQPVNQPLSPYAASKKSAEVMAYTYHKLYGLDITILRYFTVFGPAGRPDMSPFRFIKWIAEETPILLYGDGSQTRDFTYVDDVARATILAALTQTGYEIINIGGGRNPVTISYLIEYIEKAYQKVAVINHQPFHAADMMDTSANIDKAEKILKWVPQVSIEEGFSRTVEWYKSNSSWLQNIEV